MALIKHSRFAGYGFELTHNKANGNIKLELGTGFFADVTGFEIFLNDLKEVYTELTGVDADYLESLKAMIRAGRKLEAIKDYKLRTGIGLKEAKEFIDTL